MGNKYPTDESPLIRAECVTPDEAREAIARVQKAAQDEIERVKWIGFLSGQEHAEAVVKALMEALEMARSNLSKTGVPLTCDRIDSALAKGRAFLKG